MLIPEAQISEGEKWEPRRCKLEAPLLIRQISCVPRTCMSIPHQSLIILPSTAVQMRLRDCYVRREYTQKYRDVCGLLLILKNFHSSVQLALALSPAVQS